MLIPQYRVKARAVLSNSWSEEILLLQSQPQSSETSATSGTGITEGSDTFFNNDIVEAWHPSTGLCSAVPLLNSASFKSVVWIATAPQLLLGWYPETSTVVGLHRDQQQEKAISFRLQLPLKSPQAIGVCCVSSLSDGICFLALKREPTIYVLHYSGEKVVSTKPIRVEKLLGHTEKPKGSIVSMYCHPSRQFLVVAYSKGSVQIYSYVQVHLLLRKSLAKAQTDVDFLSRQSGTESAEEGEHPESDEEVEGAEGNIVSKARRILSQAGLLQPIGMMVAPRDKRLLMFVQCGRRDNFNRETGIADLELTASDIQMDYHGSFAAVVWSSSLTCIYDTSVLPTQEQVTKAAKVIMRSGSSTVASRFPVIEVGLYGTFPAALCSSAALNSSSGIVEVALGPLAFHPSEALLLQTVLRKKSAKTRNSSGVLDSNDRIAVPPLVFGLSLVTSQPFLHFVGCSVLTEDVDLKDSDSTCLNYRPLRMHFTPNSCRLVLSVECIQLHQLSSGFIKKNALGVHEINSSFLGESAVDMKAEDEAEDGTETSIENAGVEKTSDVLQSVNVQYKKDSPFQVLVEEIVFSYSIDSIWSRKNGFLNVFPVYSKLQVPVDVFLHGEMVLSPSHQYNYDSAQPGINSNGKFPESGVSNTSIIKNVGANFGGAKLVDMKGQTSNTKHDISPIWIIKPKAYIVNGIPKLVSPPMYELWAINWAQMQSSGEVGSTTAVVGTIPLNITKDMIVASTSTAQWLSLPPTCSLTIPNTNNSCKFCPLEVTFLSVERNGYLSPFKLLAIRGSVQFDLPVALSSSASYLPLEAGVAGASVADTFEALDQKGRHSSVCFVVVHLPEGEVQGNLGESGDLKYFSSFRDIAHVATVSDTPTAVLLRGVLGSSYKNPSGMIFSISDDGLKMHLLHYGAPERSSHTDAFSVGFDSDPFGVSAAGDSSSVSPGLETLTIINTYTLQRESFRVWINSDGSSEVVLLLCAAPNSSGNWCLFQTSLSDLFGKRTGGHSVEAVDSSNFASQEMELPLMEGEEVIELVFQPAASSIATRYSAGSVQEEAVQLRLLHSAWSQTSTGVVAKTRQLVGLLTNSRVLLLGSDLSILESVTHSFVLQRHDNYDTSERMGIVGNQRVTISNTFSTAAITSISWIGASLCCCSVDGKVTYLSVPISATEKVETETSTLIGRSTGCLLTGNKDSVLYSWMSMPTNLGANGSLALLGVLTDRVIVMHTKMNKVHGGTQVSVTFRPANPVEPLLVSLIRLCDREESFPREYQFLLIAALLSYYYPLKQNAASTGQGALPTTQNSRFLVNFLYRARHCKELAAIIAGIPADVSEGANAAEFPALRWLSPAVRTELCFFARNNALNLSYLGREILGHKPDLQDLYIYGDAYGGNKLPSLRGDFSQRLSYAAATGKSDSRGSTISRKLADIAGDYLQAAHLSSEVENQAKSAETFVRNCINCNVSTIKATILTTIQGKLPSSSINEEARISFLRRRLYLGNLQDFDRNRSVPTLSVALTKEDYKCEHSSMMHLIEERRQEAHQRRGGGIGVSNGTVLGTLGLDVMEDFMGINHQLELLIPDVIDGVATEVQGDGASAAPSDWVEGVGQGREFDKVVGYWRFSDYAYEGEEFFSSVSTNPGSHLVVLDLSKFEVGLELVTDATATEGSVAFLPTSSGIDAGEKHDNTKALYDVVINGSVMLQHGTGSYLRSYVPRGSQLDVGLYHQDLSRLRCTMEIAIAFDVSQHPNNVAAQVLSSCESHTLLERAIVAGDYLHDTGLLWKLWVDKGGSVALSIRTDAGKIVDVRTEASMLTFGQLDSSSKNKDDELDDLAENSGSLRWHHIAVVLEGSPSRPFEEDNKMLWSSSTLNVNIYVDGQRCANSQISLSAISAQELERNMFYVGRGLCTGWRYTELRIWAEARRESEIDGARDQFLPLAMKRRRQQLRMKGTKKLFSAFAAAQTPLPEPSKSVYLPRFATFEFNEKANAAAADETASAAATSTSKSIANSEVVMEVLAPPLPLGAPPPPSTNRRRSVAGPLPSPLGPGLLKPPTLLPAVSQRELEVKAASSSLNDGEYSTEHNGEVNGGTSANPGLSSAAKARLARRRMTMPANVVATSAGDHVQMPPVDSSDRELNAAEPKGDSVGIDPSKKTEEPNEVAKQIPASFVDNRLEIPNSEQLLSPNLLQDKLPSEAVLASIDDVAVDDKANSSADSAAKTIATVANIKSTHSKEYWWSEIISMSKIGCAFTLDRLVRTTQSKLISHPQNLVLPVVDNKVVELVDLQQHPKPLPSTDPFRLLRTEAAFFDSAVSSFCKSGDDNRLLVTYTSNNKTISFYQWRDDGVTLFLDGFYEMTLPSPLAFWTFVTPEVLLVVTSSAGYSWKVSHKPSGFVVSKPMKILERIDVESPVRWSRRTVVDVSVYQDGWTMLTSCDNFAPELASFVEANPMRKLNASRDELTSVASKSGEDKDSDRRLPSITALNHDLLNSYRVVLHHAKTGKGVTFRARAGCFRANTVIIAWYNDLEVASPTSEDQSKKLYSWKLMCISIPELLRYLQNSEREDGTSLKTALPMRSVSIRSGSDYVEQETSDALSCDWLISLPCESPSVVTPNYHTVESSKSESRASKASYRPVTAPLGYLYPLADRLFFLTNTGLLYELAEPRTKSETSIALNVMPSVLRLPSAGTVADSATSTAGKEIDSWIHSCALDTSGSDGPSLLLLQINCGLGASGSSSASASALQGSDSARIVRVFLKGASALLAKKRRQSK